MRSRAGRLVLRRCRKQARLLLVRGLFSSAFLLLEVNRRIRGGIRVATTVASALFAGRCVAIAAALLDPYLGATLIALARLCIEPGLATTCSQKYARGRGGWEPIAALLALLKMKQQEHNCRVFSAMCGALSGTACTSGP